MSTGKENTSLSLHANTPTSEPGNENYLASMMQTAVHTAIMLDSKFQLVAEVNIGLLLPDDFDIALQPEVVFQEFLLGIGENDEQQLKLETRRARLTGESACLNVACDLIDSITHYEIYIRPLAQGRVAGTHCVLHIHETGITPLIANPAPKPQENNPEQLDNKQLEKEQLDTELMHDIFAISSDAIIIFDRCQKVIMTNPAFDKSIAKHCGKLESSADINFYNAQQECLNNKLWQSLLYENNWCGEVYTQKSGESKSPYWLTIDAFHKTDPQNSYDRVASHYLFSLRDISELKKTQAALEHSATHDQLTGLPNRSFFLSHLRKAMARAERQQTLGALLFIDLDNFKLINDIKGHLIGDVVLLMMATRLKKTFRNGEIVARLGGDEFTLIAEDIQSPNNATMIAQRILDALATPFEVEDMKLDIQCSIGISIFPSANTTAVQLIKQADTAMYAAKSGGKNNFQLYDSELTKETARKFTIESHIRNAIENGELSLHYQPQVNMKNNKLIGAEALLRWHNHELGPISPAVFVPVLESSGMIDEIGYWVLDNACQQLSIWEKFSRKRGVLSVNASRLQLVKSNFVQTIGDLLIKHDISGAQLEIEVTENAFTSSEQGMINNLHTLREMGCKIAIDDFGTGYSSLSNLQSFPLDRLKIDRSFVEKLDHDASAVTIASAIVSLGKSLGLDVIAEGVETKPQVKQLIKMGCRHAQGYYYGKPLSATEFNQNFLR